MKILGIVAGRHGGNSETLVKEALLAAQEKYYEDAPENEQTAVRRYTTYHTGFKSYLFEQGTCYYKLMNQALEAGNYQNGKLMDENVYHSVSNLRDFLNKCEVPQDMAVIRYVQSQTLLRMLGNRFKSVEDLLRRKNEVSQGNLIAKDNAFFSSTIMQGGAGDFALRPVELRVLVPKGTHAFYAEAHTAHPDEKELLLQAGTHFRVLKVEEKTETAEETVRRNKHHDVDESDDGSQPSIYQQNDLAYAERGKRAIVYLEVCGQMAPESPFQNTVQTK